MTWAVFGAGAQGRLTIELLRALAPAAEAVLVDDDPAHVCERAPDVPVIARGELARRVDLATARVVVALGDNRARMQVAEELAAAGATFGILVHPSAFVSPSATLGPGTVVFPGALVQSQASLGEHVIVNTGAIVEHDCVIANGASLSPGCRTGGRALVGLGAFLGVGVTLAPRVSVGDRTIVGAGAVVVADLPPDVVAYGVPARVVRPLDPASDWRRLL